MNNFKEIM